MSGRKLNNIKKEKINKVVAILKKHSSDLIPLGYQDIVLYDGNFKIAAQEIVRSLCDHDYERKNKNKKITWFCPKCGDNILNINQ